MEISNKNGRKNQLVKSFFLPKLTSKELELVNKKDNEHMLNYWLFDPDVSTEEMKLSNSSDKYIDCRCWRQTNLLKLSKLSEAPKISNVKSILSKSQIYYNKNGEFLKMRVENKIGLDVFGSVYKGSFHGQEMAMKFVPVGLIEEQNKVKATNCHLEKNISEIRLQISSGDSDILLPEALIRQQHLEKNENRELIVQIYNILIYPLYDSNLYELHQKYFDKFTDDILIDILKQCLTRKRS